jgi:uncharacterized protein
VLVDAHQHLGDCRVFDVDVDEEAVLETISTLRLDHVLLMPFPGARNVTSVHDRIAQLTDATKSCVRGIVNLNPHQDRAVFRHEAERCVRQLGFVGVKLHTVGHAVEPMSTDGRMVFEEAARLKVPVIVHTGGAGEPFASPSHVLPLAKDWPDLPIVLAHAGMGVATREAVIVAQQCPNIYLETSWCGVLDTAMIASEVGPERMMLGSDSVDNLPVEMAKYHRLGLKAEDLERCLGGTAAEVFQL